MTSFWNKYQFTCLDNNTYSIESDVNITLAKVWIAIRLSIIQNPELSDKIKRDFFWAAAVSQLLYGCPTWMLTNFMGIRLQRNSLRMLRAVLNTSWKQHSTKLQLFCYLRPTSETVQLKHRGLTGYCWRSKDKLISDILHWTCQCARPAKAYIQQCGIDASRGPARSHGW